MPRPSPTAGSAPARLAPAPRPEAPAGAARQPGARPPGQRRRRLAALLATPAALGVALACRPAPGREAGRPPPEAPPAGATVAPATAAAAHVERWLAVPATQRLHPPFPGAVVDDVRFLDGGEALALTLRFPPGPGREAWRFRLPGPPAPAPVALPDRPERAPSAPGGLGGGGAGYAWDRIGPPEPVAALSVAPRGARVAYLTTGAPPAPGASAGPAPPPAGAARFGGAPGSPTGGTPPEPAGPVPPVGPGGAPPNEVWLSVRAGEHGRRLFSLPPGAPDRLLDCSWAPDGRHLLVVATRPAAGGARRTRLIWLDAGSPLESDLPSESPAGRPGPPAGRPDAGESEGAARDLATLPAEVVPGSDAWAPGGERVALLTRAGDVTAVGIVDTAPTAGLAFTYVADVDRAAAGWGPAGPVPLPLASWDGAAGRSPAGTLPALAWSPDGRTLLFATRPTGRPAGPPGPLAGLTRPDDLPELYVAGLSGGPGAPPALRRLGQTGAAPGWRPDGSLLALTRQRRGAPPALRRASAAGQELAVLPLTALPEGATYHARWDAGRPQGVVAAAPEARDPVAPAPVEYWLVRFGLPDGAGQDAAAGRSDPPPTAPPAAPWPAPPAGQRRQ
jgi:hypothetical protein